MNKHYYSVTSEQINELEKVRKNGQVIGFANGCFDLLHDGHKHLLSSAKNFCDYLVVGLNSDESVKRIKGPKRPIEDVKIRTKKLINNHCVDLVIVFNEPTPASLIKIISPNVIIKGADYKQKKVIGEEVVKKNGGSVQLIELLPEISTSRIIKERNL